MEKITLRELALELVDYPANPVAALRGLEPSLVPIGATEVDEATAAELRRRSTTWAARREARLQREMAETRTSSRFD